MKINELIDLLKNYHDNMTVEAVYQPIYPLTGVITGVVEQNGKVYIGVAPSGEFGTREMFGGNDG